MSFWAEATSIHPEALGMRQILVWDIPTRLFHGLLTTGIVCAFAFAQFAGESSSLFPFHSMLGVVVGAILVFRIAWGMIGTRYARFTSFLFGPTNVIKYLKDALTGPGDRYVGHNPGSSYAIFLMLGLSLAVVTSGLLMSGGNEAAEEVHSLVAYALLGVIAVHVLGVILHTIRHRENIALSMLTGRKGGEAGEEIMSSAPIAGGVLALVTVLLTAGLYRNFDPVNQRTTLPLIGTIIQLGEAESENGPVPASQHRDHDDD